MLINIASRQLAALHRYFSATWQQFNNQQLCIFGNYERDRYNCCNLFLKVQSDDELHKSPDVGLFTVYFILLQKYLYNKYSVVYISIYVDQY